MLANEILAATGGLTDRSSFGAITRIAKLVSGAKRFDLSPGVIRTALTVSQSPLSGQIRALPLCRFPFQKTWFEWPGSDPIYEEFQEKRAAAYAPPPKRVGVLVETDESRQRGRMTFAWSHPFVSEISASPLSCVFDFRRDGEAVPDVAWELARASGMAESAIRELAVHDTRKLSVGRQTSDDDIVRERARWGIGPSPYFDELYQALLRVRGALPGPGTPEWRQMADDIKGEPGKVRSLVILLNSRNLTREEYQPVPEKLNKARAKQGKSPLLDYTKILIRLSHGLEKRVGAGDSRNGVRLHAVRGHLKIRKSGVFWWSDHLRGDPSKGMASGSYIIDP